ncbi:hypothetical protein E2320_012127 [Naja naja]|nr:hypothetical protein E2320_012127 [Naja naja]
MMDTVHSNSHVVAFMNSRVGQYLDDHPFCPLPDGIYRRLGHPHCVFPGFCRQYHGPGMHRSDRHGRFRNILRWCYLALHSRWIGHAVTGGFRNAEHLLPVSYNPAQLLAHSRGGRKGLQFSFETASETRGPSKRENANGSGFISKNIFDEEPEATNKE